MMGWYELQQALLDALGREHLQLNKNLVGLEETEGEGVVTLMFHVSMYWLATMLAQRLQKWA
jgi:hypothetical protein